MSLTLKGFIYFWKQQANLSQLTLFFFLCYLFIFIKCTLKDNLKCFSTANLSYLFLFFIILLETAIFFSYLRDTFPHDLFKYGACFTDGLNPRMLGLFVNNWACILAVLSRLCDGLVGCPGRKLPLIRWQLAQTLPPYYHNKNEVHSHWAENGCFLSMCLVCELKGVFLPPHQTYRYLSVREQGQSLLKQRKEGMEKPNIGSEDATHLKSHNAIIP